jgi:hypothetical protein
VSACRRLDERKGRHNTEGSENTERNGHGARLCPNGRPRYSVTIANPLKKTSVPSVRCLPLRSSRRRHADTPTRSPPVLRATLLFLRLHSTPTFSFACESMGPKLSKQ